MNVAAAREKGEDSMNDQLYATFIVSAVNVVSERTRRC